MFFQQGVEIEPKKNQRNVGDEEKRKKKRKEKKNKEKSNLKRQKSTRVSSAMGGASGG